MPSLSHKTLTLIAPYQGNVTYGKSSRYWHGARVPLLSRSTRYLALPALHPAYSIPTEPHGANHTPQFAKSAATKEAHEATLKVAAGLAALGYKVLQDADFTAQVSAMQRLGPYVGTHNIRHPQVKKSFEDWKAGTGV